MVCVLCRVNTTSTLIRSTASTVLAAVSTLRRLGDQFKRFMSPKLQGELGHLTWFHTSTFPFD